jgi:chromosome segregation ATPase
MIKSVIINNFGPIENIQFDCKKFNMFQGKSHQGKSSILQAIQWAVIGGNDEFLVRNGTATCEVILVSNNQSRIERRLTRGGSSKLYLYGPDEKPLNKPQDVLNKTYNPFLFSPTDIINMKPKDLNEFISSTISKRVKLTSEEIKLYGLEKVDLAEDPVNAIQKHYDGLYKERTGVNAIVKDFDAKTAGAQIIKQVTEEELKFMEDLVNNTEADLRKAKDTNIRIDIGKKNIDIKTKTEENVKIIKKELEDGKSVLENLDNSIKELEEINKQVSTLEAELAKDRSEVSNIKATLSKLSSGEINCPISGLIKCTTDMKPYKQKLEKSEKTLTDNGKIKFTNVTELKTKSEKLKQDIETAKDLKRKQLELDRAESILKELEIFEADPIDITETEAKLVQMKDELYKARLAKDIGTITGVDEARKRQEELNLSLEKLNKLLKEVIPGRLTIGLKGISLSKDGLFFQGLPIRRLADSMKLRICTAILKDMFTNCNLFTLDRMEIIDKNELEKYITYYAAENNSIQYFGSYVGDIGQLKIPNLNIFTMNKFKVESCNGEDR